MSRNHNRGKSIQAPKSHGEIQGGSSKPSSGAFRMNVLIAILLFIAIFKILSFIIPSADVLLVLIGSVIVQIIVEIIKFADKSGFKSKIVVILILLVGTLFSLRKSPCTIIISDSGISPIVTSKNEVLVIVSDFIGIDSLSEQTSEDLFITLKRESDEINAKGAGYPVRVEKLKTHVVDDQDNAIQISKCFNASLVIFGDVKEDSVNYYSYTNVPSFEHPERWSDNPFDASYDNNITVDKVYASGDQLNSYIVKGGSGQFITYVMLAQLYYTDDTHHDLAKQYVNLAYDWAIQNPIVPDITLAQLTVLKGIYENDDFLAIQYYTEAIYKISDDARIYTYRASRYYKTNQNDLRLVDLNTALLLFTTSSNRLHALYTDYHIATTFYSRADIYNLIQYENALSDYQSGIDIYKSSNQRSDDFTWMTLEAHRERAGIFNNLGRYNEAISEITMAIDLNDDFSKDFHYTEFTELYVDRAVLHINNHQYEKAKSDLQKAIQMNIDDGFLDEVRGRPYYVRSQLFQIQGNTIQAQLDYAAAIERGYTP